MAEIIYPDESYGIIGACFEVYNTLGCGFLEPVYQESLAIEFEHQKIPHRAQPKLEVVYRGRKLDQHYKPDFVCFDKIIVEIKTLSALMDKHRAQTLNYLHVTGFHLGLLINFGNHPKLKYERIALTESPKSKSI